MDDIVRTPRTTQMVNKAYRSYDRGDMIVCLMALLWQMLVNSAQVVRGQRHTGGLPVCVVVKVSGIAVDQLGGL